MNKTRLDLFPDGFPRLEDLKNVQLERFHPMPIIPPHDLQAYIFEELADFQEACARLFPNLEFFFGRQIQKSDSYSSNVGSNYYIFNDRVAFLFRHRIELPMCPICDSSRVFMTGEGSFGCNNQYCNFHLPAPVEYNDAMEELARMKLREYLQSYLPMNKHRITIENDIIPYVLAIFRELEIKVTSHTILKDEVHEIYFETKKGFDVGTI